MFIVGGESDRETIHQFIDTWGDPASVEEDRDPFLVKMGERLDNAHYWSAIEWRSGRFFADGEMLRRSNAAIG